MPATRREFLGRLGGAGLLAAAARLPAAEGRRPPNIVYFMSDELGYYELSCLGHPHHRTPNIDRLASEGVRFTRCLAGSSVCAPTRCCLLTGKHSGHTSVRLNGGGTPLRAGEATIASMLHDAGYATGGFGKWGCGGRGSTGVPEEHGFDTFLGYYDQVHAHSYYPPYLVHNSQELPLAGNRGGREGQTYSHYVIFDAALQFIRANQSRPFFCYLPVTPPHGLHDIPATDPSWELFKDQDWPADAKGYAAMVNMVDRNVGQVLALLQELGLDEDTVFFFSGDNGGADNFKSQDHPRGLLAPNVDPRTGEAWRGQKGSLYEGGLRVPMLVRWPGRIDPGRVSDLLWYFPDVLPTIAALTGTRAPAELDGMSIAPELLGQGTQPQHEHLYWELTGRQAVRVGDLKAVKPGQDQDWELYDLAADPGEQHNLADARPGTLGKLTALAELSTVPAIEGTFARTDLHERDRRAKWGDTQPPGQPAVTGRSLPQDGLIPHAELALVRASSENPANQRYARNAIDGDPATTWHTKFTGGADPYPHELVLDLGRERTVRGLRYLARQDNSDNGSVANFEILVATTPEGFGAPVATGTFKQVKTAQEVTFAPVKGRYLMFRALSEVTGGPWASAAEVGVVGE